MNMTLLFVPNLVPISWSLVTIKGSLIFRPFLKPNDFPPRSDFRRWYELIDYVIVAYGFTLNGICLIAAVIYSGFLHDWCTVVLSLLFLVVWSIGLLMLAGRGRVWFVRLPPFWHWLYRFAPLAFVACKIVIDWYYISDDIVTLK